MITSIRYSKQYLINDQHLAKLYFLSLMHSKSILIFSNLHIKNEEFAGHNLGVSRSMAYPHAFSLTVPLLYVTSYLAPISTCWSFHNQAPVPSPQESLLHPSIWSTISSSSLPKYVISVQGLSCSIISTPFSQISPYLIYSKHKFWGVRPHT